MFDDRFIEAAAGLGERLRCWLAGKREWPELDRAVEQSRQENPFFTVRFQREALRAVAEDFLERRVLESWLGPYRSRTEASPECRRTVGVVMAGNLPAVGFHDLLCVLACGYAAQVKLSSRDRRLIPVLFPEREWPDQVVYVNRPEGVDALLTMGGDAAAAYFRAAFPGIPAIVRHARTSCAWLTGRESAGELEALARDILLYFGMGCRSVTYLLVPRGYDFSPLEQALAACGEWTDEPAFRRLVLRERALLRMEGLPYREAGGILLRPMPFASVPPGTVGYAEYGSVADADAFRTENRERIQKFYRTFGGAQRPAPDDYPDGADTLSFLMNV